MSDLDKEELIATRRLHGLDDDLFEEEKEQEKMNKENDEIEYEKMIIDIPKNATAVVVTTLAGAAKIGLLMNTCTYDTQDIEERKIQEEVNNDNSKSR